MRALIFSLNILVILFCQRATAKVVRYELNVTQSPVNITGKKEVDFSILVNGGIPAPTLEFTEGDDAEITVKNSIPTGEDVSIHWHGILLPPLEDGVPFVNTPPIYRGQSRTFKFKIRQNGTYWYHSHTMLQEQKGVYGAIVIHPRKETIKTDKEIVAVLSDWSDENADQILRNLKKDGDYYTFKKGTMRSYFGAIESGKLKNQFRNEWSRMGGMDLSDVGYDAFLINGKRDVQLLEAHPGEKIRIRIVNAASSTYFRVSLGGLPMKIISADGIDVEPISANEVLIGMAETYDILFQVPDHSNYELRATAQDGTGFSSGWIGMGKKILAPDVEKPDLYSVMEHSGMSTMDHSSMGKEESSKTKEVDHSNMNMDMNGKEQSLKHGSESKSKPNSSHTMETESEMDNMPGMNHSTKPAEEKKDSKDAPVELLNVDNLKALNPMSLPKNVKVHELKLVLDGDMRRYVWLINGKTIMEDRTIIINPGEVVRITYQNNSMMHHPMHLHGHFFRVINENGDFSPLKHTVDVPPMSSRTIVFYADEPGQWMLHCHNLYHMDAGMAKVVKYSNFISPPEILAHEKMDHHRVDPWYTKGKLELSSNHAQGAFRVSQSWNQVDARIEGANREGKNFSFEKNWEAEGDLLYRRWISNWTNLVLGGTSYGTKYYGVAGIGYTLPFLFETNFLINHKGQFRLDVNRKFQWTTNILSDVEVTWRPGDQGGESELEIESSLMYSSSWSWTAGFMFTRNSIGAGIEYQF